MSRPSKNISQSQIITPKKAVNILIDVQNGRDGAMLKLESILSSEEEHTDFIDALIRAKEDLSSKEFGLVNKDKLRDKLRAHLQTSSSNVFGNIYHKTKKTVSTVMEAREDKDVKINPDDFYQIWSWSLFRAGVLENSSKQQKEFGSDLEKLLKAQGDLAKAVRHHDKDGLTEMMKMIRDGASLEQIKKINPKFINLASITRRGEEKKKESPVVIHTQEKIYDETPLHIATNLPEEHSPEEEQRAVNIIGYLIANGANIDAVDSNGNTPLHNLAKSGSRAMINAFMANALTKHKDINLNPQNKDGDTPLHLAVRFKKSDAVEELLKFAPNVNLPNNKKVTALHIAVRNGDESLIKLLLEKGADIFAQALVNNERKNTLQLAGDLLAAFKRNIAAKELRNETITKEERHDEALVTRIITMIANSYAVKLQKIIQDNDIRQMEYWLENVRINFESPGIENMVKNHMAQIEAYLITTRQKSMMENFSHLEKRLKYDRAEYERQSEKEAMKIIFPEDQGEEKKESISRKIIALNNYRDKEIRALMNKPSDFAEQDLNKTSKSFLEEAVRVDEPTKQKEKKETRKLESLMTSYEVMKQILVQTVGGSVDEYKDYHDLAYLILLIKEERNPRKEILDILGLILAVCEESENPEYKDLIFDVGNKGDRGAMSLLIKLAEKLEPGVKETKEEGGGDEELDVTLDMCKAHLKRTTVFAELKNIAVKNPALEVEMSYSAKKKDWREVIRLANLDRDECEKREVAIGEKQGNELLILAFHLVVEGFAHNAANYALAKSSDQSKDRYERRMHAFREIIKSMVRQNPRLLSNSKSAVGLTAIEQIITNIPKIIAEAAGITSIAITPEQRKKLYKKAKIDELIIEITEAHKSTVDPAASEEIIASEYSEYAKYAIKNFDNNVLQTLLDIISGPEVGDRDGVTLLSFASQKYKNIYGAEVINYEALGKILSMPQKVVDEEYLAAVQLWKEGFTAARSAEFFKVLKKISEKTSAIEINIEPEISVADHKEPSSGERESISAISTTSTESTTSTTRESIGTGFRVSLGKFFGGSRKSLASTSFTPLPSTSLPSAPPTPSFSRRESEAAEVKDSESAKLKAQLKTITEQIEKEFQNNMLTAEQRLIKEQSEEKEKKEKNEKIETSLKQEGFKWVFDFIDLMGDREKRSEFLNDQNKVAEFLANINGVFPPGGITMKKLIAYNKKDPALLEEKALMLINKFKEMSSLVTGYIRQYPLALQDSRNANQREAIGSLLANITAFVGTFPTNFKMLTRNYKLEKVGENVSFRSGFRILDGQKGIVSTTKTIRPKKVVKEDQPQSEEKKEPVKETEEQRATKELLEKGYECILKELSGDDLSNLNNNDEFNNKLDEMLKKDQGGNTILQKEVSAVSADNNDDKFMLAKLGILQSKLMGIRHNAGLFDQINKGRANIVKIRSGENIGTVSAVPKAEERTLEQTTKKIGDVVAHLEELIEILKAKPAEIPAADRIPSASTTPIPGSLPLSSRGSSVSLSREAST